MRYALRALMMLYSVCIPICLCASSRFTGIFWYPMRIKRFASSVVRVMVCPTAAFSPSRIQSQCRAWKRNGKIIVAGVGRQRFDVFEENVEALQGGKKNGRRCSRHQSRVAPSSALPRLCPGASCASSNREFVLKKLCPKSPWVYSLSFAYM